MTDKTDNRTRQRLFLLGKIAFSIALLAYILSSIDLPALGQSLKNIKLQYFSLALLFFCLGLPLRTLRWSIFLRQKKVHISQGRLLQLYFIGMFFNQFLPTSFGGDAVRTWFIHREHRSAHIPATSVVAERLCGVFALFCIGLVSSLYWLMSGTQSPVAVSAFTLCLSGVAGILFLTAAPLHSLLTRLFHFFKMRWGWEPVDNIYHSCREYTENKPDILRAVLLSLCTSASSILIGYYLSLALSWGLPLSVFLFTIPIITVIIMVPVTLGGVGLRETAFLLVFSQFGVPGQKAVALALLWFAVNILSGLAGGICFALYRAGKDDA